MNGADPHFLPVEYLRSGPAINVGIIGRSGIGKTHLLAGIMREIGNDALERYDIKTRAVDIAAHDRFRTQKIVPLYEQNQMLPSTPPSQAVDFSDGVTLTTGTERRPLMFFDVAGENLLAQQQLSPTSQFIAALDALMFVVPADETANDATFSVTLDRLDSRRGPDGLLDVPAVVVVTKCDKARFVEPIDRWIRQRDRIQSADQRAESRDVYAYLHSRGLKQLLTPVSRCRRSSLHFVSATGTSAVGQRFPRGAEPQRCLAPLLSLLRMTDVLPAAQGAVT